MTNKNMHATAILHFSGSLIHLLFHFMLIYLHLNGTYHSGFSLFLGFLIDRMHHYLRKLIVLRSSAGSSKKEFERLEKEKLQLKEKADKAAEEIKLSQKQLSSLTETLKKVKLESEEKDKRVETAEAHVAALQKQAADLLLEYDRLLEDNQNLQNQAHGYRS